MRRLLLVLMLCTSVLPAQQFAARDETLTNLPFICSRVVKSVLLEPEAEVKVKETGHDADEHSQPSNSTSAVTSRSEAPQPSIAWGDLFKHELLFLATMHSFRIATEPSTREALGNSFFGGYFAGLEAMHGWSDGDGYYETYLGHPIQGAVSGYMWIHHDLHYRVVQFGKSRDYWMSRLRAYGWSWVESEQFKIGLVSEATIGQIPRYCCGYGFNDHIMTNNGGMVWIVGGDILDRYIVRRIEDHTTSVPLRLIARVALAPPLGMANLMDINYPWHRENRPGVRKYRGELYSRPANEQNIGNFELPIVPRFELTASIPTITRYGNLSCAGGRGVAGYRVSNTWQWSGDVGGCMLLDMPRGWSGDSLSFTTGPQWILHTTSRWVPHLHFRAGGQKITEEYCLNYGPPPSGLALRKPCQSDPSGYARHYETTGGSISAGGGLDIRWNRAFDVRLADFEYAHTWVPELNRRDFSKGYRISVGIGLKVGTW